MPRSHFPAILSACALAGCYQPANPTPAQRVYMETRDSVVKIYSLSSTPSDNRSGTGFAANIRNGQIVTNRHVVEKASVVIVETSSGVWSVPSWMEHPNLDVALLPIPATESMPLLDLKSASDLSPGSEVFTVGYPLGDLLAVHEGSVSSIDGMELVFSAPLSTGASGSPLLDSKSNVVGLCHSFVPDAQNYNLALPSDFITMDYQWLVKKSSPDPQLAAYLKEIVRAKSLTRKSIGEWEMIASDYPEWSGWIRKTMLTRRPLMKTLEDTSLAVHSVDWSTAAAAKPSPEDMLSALMMEKNAVKLIEAWNLHLKNMEAASPLAPANLQIFAIHDMDFVPALAAATKKIAAALCPVEQGRDEKPSAFAIKIQSLGSATNDPPPPPATYLVSALQEYLELEARWEKACLP